MSQGRGKINEPFKGKKKVPDSVIDEILFKKHPVACKLLFIDMFDEWIRKSFDRMGDRKKYKELRAEYWESPLMKWAVDLVQAHCNYHPYTYSNLATRLSRTYKRLYKNKG